MKLPMRSIKAMIAAAMLAGYAADAAELALPQASVTLTETAMPEDETLPLDEGANAAAVMIERILTGN